MVWFRGRSLVHAFLLSKSSTTILPGVLHGTGRASHDDEEQSIPEKPWGRVTRKFGWELPDVLNELDDNGRWKGNVTIRGRSSPLLLEISSLPQDKLPRIRLLQTLQALEYALCSDDFLLWVTRAFRTQHCLDQVNHQTNDDHSTKPLDMQQFADRLQLESLHVSPTTLVDMPKCTFPCNQEESYCNPYIDVAEDGKVVQSMSFHAQVGVQGFHLDDTVQMSLSGNGTMSPGRDYGWTPYQLHCYEWNDDNLCSYLMQPSDLPEALHSIGGVMLRDLDSLESFKEWEQYLTIMCPGHCKGQYLASVSLCINDKTFVLENDTASPQELETFRRMLDCLSKLLYEESFVQQIHGRFHDEESLQEANERIAFNLACSSSSEDTAQLPDYPMTMETYKSLIEICSLTMFPKSCSSDGSPTNHEGKRSKITYQFNVELAIGGIGFDDQPMGIGGLILGPNQYEF